MALVSAFSMNIHVPALQLRLCSPRVRCSTPRVFACCSPGQMKWQKALVSTLAATAISFCGTGLLPAVADLNKFEAELRGEFGIGSAAQFGSADLRNAVHVNENFRTQCKPAGADCFDEAVEEAVGGPYGLVQSLWFGSVLTDGLREAVGEGRRKGRSLREKP